MQLSADKRLILRGCWRLIGQISLHPHVQVVLLPKPGDLRHHGGGVVGVISSANFRAAPRLPV